MNAFDVTVWTCVLIFVAIGLIAVLALVNKVRLGQTSEDHDRYVKTLFNVLLMGIIIAGITTFAVYLKDRLSAFEIVIWSSAVIFVVTGLIASLSLINKLKLGDTSKEHSYYKRKLFNLLIVEIVIAGTVAFGIYLKDSPVISQLKREKAELQSQKDALEDNIFSLTGERTGDFAGRDHWNRGTAHWDRAQKEINDSSKYNESLKYALEEYNLALGSKLDNPYNRVHVATVLNELGRYPEAEKEIEAVYNLASFQNEGKGTRGWALSELAIALYMQNKMVGYEKIANEAYNIGANFRDYIPKTIRKYQDNDSRRKPLSH